MNTHPTPEQLSAALDGELPVADRAAVDAHVRACTECSGWLAEMRALDGLVEETLPAVPPGYFENFGARLRPRLTSRPRPRVLARPWMAAAAAAVVVAVLVPVLLRQDVAAPPEKAVPRGVPVAPQAAPKADAGTLGRERADAPLPPATWPAQPAPARPAAESKLQEAGQATGMAQPPALEEKKERATEPDAREADEAEERFQAPPPAAPAAVAAPARDALEETVVLQDRQEAAPAERRKAESQNAAGLAAAPEPLTPDEARDRREDARKRAGKRKDTAGDAARVEVVEMGVRAWRLSGSEADRRQALADAEAYLRWPDGRYGDRVRALRDALRR